MSNEGEFIKAEVELSEVTVGKKKSASVPVPSKAKSVELIPDKITSTWVAAQATADEWRKSKLLNPEMVMHMHKLARQGLSKGAVCGRMGISSGNWNRWTVQAMNGDEPYMTWYRCMMHATGDLEAELITDVRKAAASDWKAATWLLGKINREEYSDKSNGITNNIHVDGDAVDKKTVNSMTEADAAKIASLMDQIGALRPAMEAEVVEEDET